MPIGDRQLGTGRLSEDALRRLTQPTPVQPPQPPAAPAVPAEPIGGGAPPNVDTGVTAGGNPIGGAGNAEYGQLPWGEAPDIGAELTGTAKGVKNELQNVTTALKAHLGMVDEGQAARLKTVQDHMDKAGAVFTMVGGMGTVAQGEELAQKGDVGLGATTALQGGLQTTSGAFKLAGNGARSGQAMGASVIVGGVTNSIKGVEDLRKGNIAQGSIELAQGAIGSASGVTGLVAAAAKGSLKDNAAIREAVGNGIGRFAAPLTLVGAGIGGALSVANGIDQIRNGKVIDGVLSIGQGTLNAAAGAAFTVNAIGTASEALQTFGKAAGPLGAAAGIVGGGMQVYDALSKNPPDYKSAALGATNAVASGMLLAPPPADIAGGAILIGTALYQNVKPVQDVVNGAIGGAVDVGKGVVNGVEDFASGEVQAGKDLVSGVANAGGNLAHGDLIGAARDLAGGGVSAVGDVAKGAVHAVGDVAHGVEDAAKSVAKGVSSAAKSVASGVKSVGHFISSLF